MLILSNDDVRQVLTIEDTIDALRQSYADVAAGIGVCRPRIDFRMPTQDKSHYYLWSTMDGGSTRTGYLASRMVSDVRHSETYGGVETSEEYCIRPGLFFGIVFLFQLALPSEIPGYVLGMVRYPMAKYLVALALVEIPYAAATVWLGQEFLRI